METLKKMIEEVLDKVKVENEKEIENWYIQSEKLVQKYLQELILKIKSIEDDYNRKIEFLKNTAISSVEMEIKSYYLQLINNYIDKAIDLALNKFKNKEIKEKYLESLSKFILEGIDIINENEINVYCNPEDYDFIIKMKEKIEKEKNVKLNIISKNISEYGGVILTNKYNTIAYNNTIEGRFSRFKENIRKIIADILLGD